MTGKAGWQLRELTKQANRRKMAAKQGGMPDRIKRYLEIVDAEQIDALIEWLDSDPCAVDKMIEFLDERGKLQSLPANG